MQVNIDDIKVHDRLRQDAGDLTPLVESIHKVGLIHPILLSESYELLSGFRRLAACKQLGWETIEAKIVPLEQDRLAKLELEYHENVGRHDLNENDIVLYHERKARLLKPDRPSGLWKWLLTLWHKIQSVFSKKSTS